MEKEMWTTSDIQKLYKFKERQKSLQVLYQAEDKGLIPKATRIPRGKIDVRNWPLHELPSIGRRLGFLPPPIKQIILCKYIQKGGVLKTSTSFSEAKTLALNGIKTLIIGQDFECSITDVLLDPSEISFLHQSPNRLGLYHLLAESAPIQDVIHKTSLPTLDIIAETHDLVIADRWLSQQQRREYIYKDKLLPYLKDYEVVIFDNGSNWNHLTENAIAVSDCVISPLGCNLLAYNASETNLKIISEFKKTMGLSKQLHIMFPTLLERSSLSQQIYAQYLANFPNNIIPIPIRSSVKAQEAIMHRQTIFEYAPSSQQAQDYYELISQMWKIILSCIPNDIGICNNDSANIPLAAKG